MNTKAFRLVPDASDHFALEVGNFQETPVVAEGHHKGSRPTAAPSSVVGRLRRAKDERGLPADEAIVKLARTYLENQRKLWPDLAAAGVLPAPAEVTFEKMAAGFKQQFLNGRFRPFEKSIPGIPLGVAYDRYSCDNSNPRSLDDQLRLQLNRASEHKVFVPWEYVFADASVSGTIANRTGYKLAKDALQHKGVGAIVNLYIDEVGRASRDAIEALRLGDLVKKTAKRMLGVSDAFDSDSEMSRLMLHMFAMLNEWFIQQLRTKVYRGMKGAATRMSSTGKPPLGLKLVPMLDRKGDPVVGKDGNRTNTYAIDEETIEFVDLAFDLFSNKLKPGKHIASQFNQLRVAGRNSWSSSSILQLLRRRVYVGILVYNQTRNIIDTDTGKRTTIENPRSEWVVGRKRELQRISWKLWKKTQRRLAEVRAASPNTGKKLARKSDMFPTLWLSGILDCDCCGHELLLIRSTEKYKQLGCPNGIQALHGCTFKGSKSVRIIEDCLLGHLFKQVLTEDRLKALVAAANAYLAEESAKPKEDTSGLERMLAEKRTQQKNLISLVKDDNSEDLEAVRNSIKAMSKEIRGLEVQIHAARSKYVETPPPLDFGIALALLKDAAALLDQEPSTANPILKQVFGRVRVKQVAVVGRKKPQWVAMVKADVVPLIASAAMASNCPDSLTWAFLSQRIWIKTASVEVRIEEVPKYQAIADEAVKMVEAGATATEAAKILNVHPNVLAKAFRFGKHGVSDWRRSPDMKRLNPPHRQAKAVRLETDIIRMRHE